MKTLKRRELLEGCFNVIGAASYILSCGFLLVDFDATHRTSNLFMLARRFIFALFFITRKTPPKQTNTSPRDWIVAFCGTYMLNFLMPAPEIHDNIYIECIQALGFVVCIAGALSLNESFGVVAANRGIKSSGMYKYLRHPIYCGYFLEAGAYLAQNLTAQNIVVMLIWTIFQFRRIFIEEQYLSKDDAYKHYMQKVRWRIIPFVY
jgi:protein-S-isoprenylcysteine O-methyltransferase Ste14